MLSETGNKRLDLSIPVTVPPLFKCPISLELMTYPVSLCIGMTHDRDSIEKWLDEGNSVCPVTLEFIQSKELIPDHTLRRLIQDWCVANSSNGVLRIPTPKPVVERSKVRQMIQDIQDATINKFEALKNLRSLAKASERNRQGLKSAGVFPVLIHILDSKALMISEEGVDREGMEEAVADCSLWMIYLLK